MNAWLADVRYGFRRLLSTPGFTLVALATLALGIGANTAIYSVVDALMLKPLPYRDPERLTELANATREGFFAPSFRAEQWLDWRKSNDVFEQLEPYTNRSVTVSGAGEPENLIGSAVGGGLMQMLGVPPRLGRLIQPGDAAPGRDHVVVLSEDLWRRRYGGDPKVVGKSIRLDDQSYDVVGVMARAFNFPYGRRQFWVPLAIDSGPNAPRPSLVGRIRPDVSMSEAQARMDVISAQAVTAKRAPAGWKVRLGPLTARHLNKPIARALYVLVGAVALVLLIACANVANLLLIQGAARRREVAVRAALGASRARIVRQLLTETLLLALAGGAAGLIVAEWAVDLLSAYAPSEMTFLTIHAIAINSRVLTYAIALTIVTALSFGLLPALRGSGDDVHGALKQGARSATGSPRQERLRRAFVFVQLALSLMLLVGAGLLMRTFIRLTGEHPGFDARNLVAVDLSLPRWKYRTGEAQKRFYDDLLAGLAGLHGVTGVTLAGGAPPGGGGISFGLRFEIDGRGVVLDNRDLIMPFNNVDPDYFALMRIPLRAGRGFVPDDAIASPARPIVISEEMSRRLWKGEDPVGHRIRFDADDPWYTVVGVVGDVYQFRHDQPRGQFAVYFPGAPRAAGQQTLLVRTAGDPADAIAAIKRRIWDVDAELPISKITSVEAAYGAFFAAPRFYAWLMGAFAAIGLAIAAIGLYGVLAYATVQRTREFGIRLALGASIGDVLRLVLSSGLIVTVAGIAAGVAGSLVVTRTLGSLLVDVPASDPVTYAGVTAVFAAVALAACWIPARRATRIDPAVTLRCD